jgi:hypothetical protein
MRIVVGCRAKNQTAASAEELARYKTETLSRKEYLEHLMDLSGQWIDQAHHHRRLTKLILDMDRSVVAVPRKLFARVLERTAHLRPACASG